MKMLYCTKMAADVNAGAQSINSLSPRWKTRGAALLTERFTVICEYLLSGIADLLLAKSQTIS